MKIFSADQLRDIDSYTMEHEPVIEEQLIRRAGKNLACQTKKYLGKDQRVGVLVGKGNNGADALVVARELMLSGYGISLYMPGLDSCSETARVLYQEILGHQSSLLSVGTYGDLLSTREPGVDVLIDGLLGTGLNRVVAGDVAGIIRYVNGSGCKVFSIDIPSGLFCGDNSRNDLSMCVNAHVTFTVQFPKLCFMFPEVARCVGDVVVVPIGLHEDIINDLDSPFRTIERGDLGLKSRDRFAYKNMYGHVLVIAGSKGKMGACSLASRAALRAGAGLVTSFVPGCGLNVLQVAVPEAMADCDTSYDYITTCPGVGKYSAVAIGPGLGTNPGTIEAVRQVLSSCTSPMVVDADALNCIAMGGQMLELLPRGSVLTPHVKEFERLFGAFPDSYSRMLAQVSWSVKLSVVIVLKGHRTCITTPGGGVFFNTTGNPGMATAGSGDVLTGIIAGLLAQGYTPEEAAKTGVYTHGLAGDIASGSLSEEGLMASDIISYLPQAYTALRRNS